MEEEKKTETIEKPDELPEAIKGILSFITERFEPAVDGEQLIRMTTAQLEEEICSFCGVRPPMQLIFDFMVKHNFKYDSWSGEFKLAWIMKPKG